MLDRQSISVVQICDNCWLSWWTLTAKWDLLHYTALSNCSLASTEPQNSPWRKRPGHETCGQKVCCQFIFNRASPETAHLSQHNKHWPITMKYDTVCNILSVDFIHNFTGSGWVLEINVKDVNSAWLLSTERHFRTNPHQQIIYNNLCSSTDFQFLMLCLLRLLINPSIDLPLSRRRHASDMQTDWQISRVA